jgi:hypothetical protein
VINLNKKFLKYSITAIVVTYTALFININYSSKYGKPSSKQSIKTNKVSASVLDIFKDENKAVLISEGAYFTPCLNSEGVKLLYSSGDDIYELDLVKNDIKQLTYMGGCYNPIYFSRDNNTITFARNDGIFIMDINKKDIKKIIGSDKPETSYAKPNFTPEGDIIYFSVTVLPRQDGHGFIEKNPAIYRVSRDGKTNEKIIEGYNPALSADGKNLLYELGDNIYVMNLESKQSKLIDSGKYASWSNSGKYISYSKFERGVNPYSKVRSAKKLFIDKEYSNIFIADLDNLKNKEKVTKEEFEDRNIEIKDWAKDIQDSSAEQHFLLVSKIAYFDTVWSKEDKELYISCYNGDKGAFELIKYNINK